MYGIRPKVSLRGLLLAIAAIAVLFGFTTQWNRKCLAQEKFVSFCERHRAIVRYSFNKNAIYDLDPPGFLHQYAGVDRVYRLHSVANLHFSDRQTIGDFLSLKRNVKIEHCGVWLGEEFSAADAKELMKAGVTSVLLDNEFVVYEGKWYEDGFPFRAQEEASGQAR